MSLARRSLWSDLIEMTIAIGKVGGAIGREEFALEAGGARLPSCRGSERLPWIGTCARLADVARMTLAGIGTTVAGVRPSPATKRWRT